MITQVQNPRGSSSLWLSRCNQEKKGKAQSQGIKQLMAGGGIALVGATLIPLLSGLFG